MDTRAFSSPTQLKMATSEPVLTFQRLSFFTGLICTLSELGSCFHCSSSCVATFKIRRDLMGLYFEKVGVLPKKPQFGEMGRVVIVTKKFTLLFRNVSRVIFSVCLSLSKKYVTRCIHPFDLQF